MPTCTRESAASTYIDLAAIVLITLASDGCHAQPSPLVIILADQHYVSRDDFASDLRSQDEPISDAEIDRQYAAFLNTVESVQVEQAAMLRGLMREHGIRQVFVEGVTESNVAAFRQAVYDLRGFDFDRLHERLIDESFDSDERAALQDTINTLRARRLELGAVAQLMLADEPIDVAPLDDDATLAAADPQANGWQFEGPANDAREAAMAGRLIEAGPVAVAIVGQGHDLRPEIKAACAGCRVDVRRAEAMGGE